MQVSSLTQSYLTSLYTNNLNKTENTTDTTSSFLNVLDSVSLSENAQKMPPPPHEMDFENMSDSDLQGYLQQMYDVTGTLPGGMEGDVSSLSEEELSELRSTLTKMSQNDPAAQALNSENSSKLTGEDVKTLLTMFMMNMQSTSSLFSDDSSSNDSSIYSLLGTSDSSMETMLSNILSKLSGENEDEETQTQSVSQKAAAAYEQSMLSV